VSDQPPAVFRKGSRSAPDGYFRWEAAGLAWLADAPGGADVVTVLDVAADHLDLAKLTFANPDPAMAESFGAALARTHDAGAAAFGSPPDGWEGDGFLGPATQLLPLQLRPRDSWGEFYAEQRLLPMLSMGVDSGLYHRSDIALFERVAHRLRDGEFDDGAPPARLHGDLWIGNVHAGADGRPWLIDPAAHGAHRELDLSMLDLFGSVSARTRAAYEEVWPLSAGFEERVALWQLQPLLVHAILFGGSYGAAVARTAGRYV
jgi:fructosamine-3-kinase